MPITIRITKEGLALFEEPFSREVSGIERYYYIGVDDKVTALLVSTGKRLEVGEIWDASSGNEMAFPGFSRKAHTKRQKLGKLTLRHVLTPEELLGMPTVVDLDRQVEYFMEKFPFRGR
jgi:hypothetical protein